MTRFIPRTSLLIRVLLVVHALTEYAVPPQDSDGFASRRLQKHQCPQHARGRRGDSASLCFGDMWVEASTGRYGWAVSRCFERAGADLISLSCRLWFSLNPRVVHHCTPAPFEDVMVATIGGGQNPEPTHSPVSFGRAAHNQDGWCRKTPFLNVGPSLHLEMDVQVRLSNTAEAASFRLRRPHGCSARQSACQRFELFPSTYLLRGGVHRL